jgi:hypothetical protein
MRTHTRIVMKLNWTLNIENLRNARYFWASLQTLCPLAFGI